MTQPRCSAAMHRANGTFTPPVASIDRHSARGFYNLAGDFHRAGMYVAESSARRDLKLRFNHVPYYLHTHSIELALKAFLRASGIEERELRVQFRHGLSDILQS